MRGHHRLPRLVAAALVAMLTLAALGPCAAMALGQGVEACTMPHVDRGHCAPDVALAAACCHPAQAPVPAETPTPSPSVAPLLLHSVFAAATVPSAPAALSRPLAVDALVQGSPPLFLQHRVLLI
jgi:hypothetical protein